MSDAGSSRLIRFASYSLVAATLLLILAWLLQGSLNPQQNLPSSSKVFFARESGTAGGTRCDSNGDGKIDASDVAVLKLYWKGFPEPHVDCDVDGKMDARNLAIYLHEWTDAPVPPDFSNLPLPVGTPSYSSRSAYHLAVPPPPASGWKVGDRFFALVLLSSGREAIGAGEVHLEYPDGPLAVRSVRTLPSIWNVWTQRPIPPYKGLLTFAGGRNGGFKGTQGVVAVVEFEVRDERSSMLVFHDGTALYKYDNVGTQEPFKLGSVDIQHPAFTAGDPSVTGTPPLLQADNAALTRRFSGPDTTPPESFEPLIVVAPSPGGPRWFIDMHTEDAMGGYVTYEVHEGLYRTVQTEDAYALRSQAPGTHPLRIVARDEARNERRVTVFVQIPGSASASFLTRVTTEGWPVLLLIPVFIVLWWVWRRRMRKRRDMIERGRVHSA